MNKPQRIGFSIMVAAVLLPIVLNSITHHVNTRKQIVEIDAETQREIAAIKLASAIVTKKIKNGGYDGKTVADMESDFEFYKVICRLNG